MAHRAIENNNHDTLLNKKCSLHNTLKLNEILFKIQIYNTVNPSIIRYTTMYFNSDSLLYLGRKR